MKLIELALRFSPRPYISVNIQHIMWIEDMKTGSMIHLVNGHKLEVSQNREAIVEKLGAV